MKNRSLLCNFAWCFIVFLSLAQLSFAQGKVITGMVTDGSNNDFLPGVTVQIKGTASGTVTGPDGTYKLTVPATSTSLVFSFIGYDSQEIVIGAQTVINVVLKSGKALEEVVVVGYGTQKKKDLTGAISSVSAKDFNKGVMQTPEQLLQGKVAGLTVTRQGGDPNRRSNVQLRGPSTLAGNTEPFYVIDGVPGASIDLVAPDDIVSIDVMKDAASTAIYGTRAANGVIMVTTKGGKSGQSTLSYSGYVAVESIAKRVKVATGDELRAYLNSEGKKLDVADDDGANTDWQKEITRLGVSHNHNISFGGGNEHTKYQASVNYFKNNGIVKNSSIERILGRLRADHSAFNDKLRLSFSVSNSVINNHYIDYAIFYQAVRFLPTVNVYKPDGTYKENLSRYDYYNPLALINQIVDERKQNILLANGRASLDLLPGLTYDVSLSYQKDNTTSGIFQERNSAFGMGNNGYARRTAYANTTKILETYFNYSKTFGDVHDLKLLAGYSYQQDDIDDGFQAQSMNFLTDDLGYYGILNGNPSGAYNYLNGSKPFKDGKLISFYGRFNYAYKNKYLLQGTLRRDGSSRFGANNKWANFPAISGAWRISEEGFMKGQQLFDDLKLRVGYGVSGYQAVDPYQSLARYGVKGAAFVNGTWINTYAYTQNPNKDLQWEKTSVFNIGIDFSIIKGRINGTVEWYDKKTTDMLDKYNVPVPPYPVPELFANVGAMNNKGVEVTLGVEVIKDRPFTWTANLNFAANKNKITSLSNEQLKKEFEYVGNPGGQGLSDIPVAIIKPGLPLGTFFTYEYAGKDKDGIAVYNNANGLQVKAKDLRREDFKVVGYALPDFTYGWNNNFQYKQLDMNLFFRGVYGNKIFNALATNLDRLSEATVVNVSKKAIEEGITKNDPPIYSSYYVENGSFLRLANATIGYTFNHKIKAIKSARIYFTAQNLFTITKFTGVDPEVDLGGKSPGIAGLGQGDTPDKRNSAIYPSTRSFSLGVNVNF